MSPTFGNIDGEESGTVTFSVRTVVQAIGSTNEQMEILVLGDPESSVAIARVSSVAPKSTDAGVNVRIIGGPSTITDFAVRALLPSTATDNLVALSSLSGALNSSNSSLYLPVRLSNGAGFLSVTDPTHGSTISTVSTNIISPGLNLMTGSDALSNTNTWIGLRGSTAGNAYVSVRTDSGASIMDSTAGAIKVNVVAGSAAGDTTVTASFAAGYVSSAAPAAGSSALLVRQVGPHGISSISTGNISLAAVIDSSGGLVTVADSANNAIKVNVVAGAAGGSTIVTVSALPLISTAVPAGNSSGLNTWLVGGNISSISTGHITVDTGSIRVVQSTAADLNVTVAGYSTTVNISSLAGPVIVRSSKADALVSVYQSTAADLNVTVAGYSTIVSVSTGHVTVDTGVIRAQTYTSSGGAIEGSTDLAAQGILALNVREAPSSIQSFAASTVGDNSTATVIVSSQANPIKVWSFIVTSTVVAPSTCGFRSSNGQAVLMPIVLGSGSSGITGAQMVSHPPHYLFRTQANNALTFNTPSTGPQFHVFCSYST